MVNSPGIGDYIREQGMQNPLALRRQIEILLADDPRHRCVLLYVGTMVPYRATCPDLVSPAPGS